MAVIHPLAAAEITLPLRLPIPVLQESLRSTLNLAADKETEVFRQGDCRYVQLNGLQLDTAGDMLRVRTRTRLKFGPDWFGSCVGAVTWQGEARFDLEPYITPEYVLRYRLRDTRLIDEQGKESLAAGLVWKLVARIMQPRLETFQLDLGPPRTELTNVLHNFVPPAQVAEVDAVLASARPTGLTLDRDNLNAPLVFEVPDKYLAATPATTLPGAAETPLTAEELAQFEQTTQAWDAFLVYIVRSLGLDIDNADLRIRLLEILLDSRYQAAAILSGEADTASGDPTRALFITTWNDLHELIADAGRRGLLHGRLLSYLSFLSAGDALFLLDQSAPGLGIEISANGLRRLARAMRPLDTRDPLQYDWSLDPFLQELFDLDVPSPDTDTPPASHLHEWLEFLIPSAAAETRPDDLQSLSDRLGQWVPAQAEMETYQAIVAALLDAVRTQELERAQLSATEAEVFRHMVPATALIESCWRQYIKSNGSVTYLRSPSGSIGLMQVNPAVWRGIFDLERLKTDAGYNAYAGTRILLRYLRRHGRPIAQRTGATEDLARASYAAYNAGPRAAGRFLKSSPKSRVRQVDDKFWKLFQGISEGGSVDLSVCGVTPSAG
ncbi:MAG TPA: lytic transglycosylase domain-containing protein [Gammaproteobacteria bacterium]